MTLRSKLIRLAAHHPEVRPALLPILSSAQGQAKQASLAGRQWFDFQLQKNTEGRHLPNVNGLDIEAFWLPLAGRAPKGEGAIFVGKSDKPARHYIYRDFVQFNAELENLTQARKEYFAQKAKRQQERKEYKHDYVAGDILSSSWGYDQTNVNFYQVVEAIGKMVLLREVGKKVVREHSSSGSEYVVATPDRFVGPPLKKMVQQGGYVRINSSELASKWDGKPKYQTAFGWGH